MIKFENRLDDTVSEESCKCQLLPFRKYLSISDEQKYNDFDGLLSFIVPNKMTIIWFMLIGLLQLKR